MRDDFHFFIVGMTWTLTFLRAYSTLRWAYIFLELLVQHYIAWLFTKCLLQCMNNPGCQDRVSLRCLHKSTFPHPCFSQFLTMPEVLVTHLQNKFSEENIIYIYSYFSKLILCFLLKGHTNSCSRSRYSKSCFVRKSKEKH